jgi:phosphatidylserine decarboxylase
MRYTDVHVQRVPLDGEVIEIEGGGEKIPKGTSPYKYASEKMLPYQKRTVFKTEIGSVAVRQITSLFASRIEVFVRIGEKVKRGQRLGRVLAGSTVVLELPMNIEILVSKNKEVIGGETIIARY